MFSLAIEKELVAHVLMLGGEPRIRIFKKFNNREYIFEGQPRKCAEKGKMICIELLATESTPEHPHPLAAGQCIEEAFERLALNGESFATILHREWMGPAIVWSRCPEQS